MRGEDNLGRLVFNSCENVEALMRHRHLVYTVTKLGELVIQSGPDLGFFAGRGLNVHQRAG